MDTATLANIASIIGAFSATMLVFRVQREVALHEQGEPTWLPWADWLILVATLLCLLLGIVLPLSIPAIDLPAAATGSATILVAGYPFAILAHYRILGGRNRNGPRENPEPAERMITIATVSLAVAFFVWRQT